MDIKLLLVMKDLFVQYDSALSNQLMCVQETLFRPEFLGKEFADLGIADMLNKCIINTNMDMRKDLWGNIVLAGGNSMYPGLEVWLLIVSIKNCARQD